MKRNRMSVVFYYPDGSRQAVETRPGVSMSYADMATWLRYAAELADRCADIELANAPAPQREGMER